MIKDIKYQGYTAIPSDYEALDGELAASYNLAPEDGAMHPVFPPQELFSLPLGTRLMFLHKTSKYTHYILFNPNDPPQLAWIDDNDRETSHLLLASSGDWDGEVYKIDAVGNTLLVLTPDGILYFLWKGGTTGYYYLGNHLPECDLQFYLGDVDTSESEEYDVDLSPGYWTRNTRPDTGEYYYTWNSECFTNAEIVQRWKNAAWAGINSVVAKVAKNKRFAFPFFIRYAYRLFDGTSLTMHSAPILMMSNYTSSGMPTLVGGSNEYPDADSGTTFKYKATLNDYPLYCKGNYYQILGLKDWHDIIAGVDIYMSPLFYDYDYEDGIRNGMVPFKKDISQDVIDNANFFLLKRLSVDEINYDTPLLASSAVVHGGTRPGSANTGLIKADFDINNDNIVVRDQMSDDYFSHDNLIPTLSYGFNSRLILSGLSKKLFQGYSPKALFYSTSYSNEKATEYKVVIDEGDKEVIVASPSANVMFNADGRIDWFFYPNPNAKAAYFKLGNDVQGVNLKRHSFLNGSYYLGIGETVTTGETMPDTTTGDAAKINMGNKLYTSEVNNPFFFPLEGVSTIGNGNVLGLCSAAKALSQGQFGQFPLYAFTTEGVWALETTSTGAFNPAQPFTEDVCTNVDSITQLDGNVLFATSRGIMLLSGSTSQCITDGINSEHPFNFSQLFSSAAAMTQWETFLSTNGFSTAGLAQVPFSTFLSGCRMIYDYVHQRIIVYNTNQNYAYIYSLKDHKWGMIQTNIDYGINSYPDALAVTDPDATTGISTVVNFSEDKTVNVIPAVAPATEPTTTPIMVKGILVTRPLKLDAPDALKTIDTIIQRGKFDFLKAGRNPKPIRVILYGSRDLYNWFMIGSSNDHNLRGYRGTPHKYFRIVLLCEFLPDESVYGATIQYNPRYLNRPR